MKSPHRISRRPPFDPSTGSGTAGSGDRLGFCDSNPLKGGVIAPSNGLARSLAPIWLRLSIAKPRQGCTDDAFRSLDASRSISVFTPTNYEPKRRGTAPSRQCIFHLDCPVNNGSRRFQTTMETVLSKLPIRLSKKRMGGAATRLRFLHASG